MNQPIDLEGLIKQLCFMEKECDRTNLGCQWYKTLATTASELASLKAENERLQGLVERATKDIQKHCYNCRNWRPHEKPDCFVRPNCHWQWRGLSESEGGR